MFLIEGIPSVIWAFVWLPVLRDRPRDATWLSPAEQQAVEHRLLSEQSGLEKVKDYREAFRSKPVVLLSFQYFFWSIGVYGFVLWLPSMIRSASKVGIVSTGWLSSVPYLLAAILMILTSYWSDRSNHRKTFVWVSLFIGAVAFYGSYLLGASNFWMSFVLLVIAGGAMYAPYGSFFAMIPEMLPRNVAGGAMALINGMGALGSFAGSYVVGYLNSLTGSPSLSYAFMAVCLLLSVVFRLVVRTRSNVLHANTSSKGAVSQ